MFDIFRRLRIRTKLLSGFLLITLIPILIVTFIVAALLKDSVETNAVRLISDILAQISQSIAKEVNDLDNMTVRLYSHPDVLRILAKDALIAPVEHDQDVLVMTHLLDEMARAKVGVFIQLFDVKRQVETMQQPFGLFTSLESFILINWTTFQHDPLFLAAQEMNGRKSAFGHLQAASWQNYDKFLVMVRALKDGKVIQGALPAQTQIRFGKTLTGAAAICIKETDLANIYKNSYLAQIGHIYLLNPDGAVLSSSDAHAVAPPFASPIAVDRFADMETQKQAYAWIEHQREKFLLSFVKIPRIGLIIYTLQPEHAVMANFYVLRDTLFLVTGISVGLAISVGLLLSTSLTKPIAAFTATMQHIQQTGYVFNDAQTNQAIRDRLAQKIHSKDEIGVMADTFMKMLSVVETAQQKLLEQERLKQEMALAQHIQMSLLPKDLQHPELEIEALMIPAEQVGGDYYDMLFDQAGHLWLGIGDVSGHGMTPGLIMMMAQTVHTTITTQWDVSPKQVVTMLNHVLYHNVTERLNADHFMTFTTFKYLGQGRFQHAGSHLDLIVYRQATQACELVDTPGVWLLFMPDIAHLTTELELTLELDDVLILYSDGLNEAENAANELFGVERLIQSITAHIAKPTAALRDAVFADVLAWSDNRCDDDMTLMVVRRTA